ncbi:YaaA family protein [Mesoterricola silvestris]|uniref:YaaA family protein n=1 Tax=Mesoterricola silvestris TaxID=2927979 RepID=UPI00292E749F|nr:peroxide stress protein YaaA [Mesoterricola silvestris]
MILLISSAKKMDFARPLPQATASQPVHLPQARVLAGILKKLDPGALGKVMAMSEDLAVQTAGRYGAWKPPFTPGNARPAALAYSGEAYNGLDAWSLDAADLAFAQDRLRILSGLYGLLRPLDLIQPYRLEMGARLANPKGPDLYAYWAGTLTRALKAALGGRPLVNLASGEFSKAVQLPAGTVTPVFLDGGKVVSFHAKRARGLMCRYAIRGRINEPAALKGFDLEGYAFDGASSTAERLVFCR